MNEATEKEKWVDVKTVAAYLGVSKASVYKWAAEEGLPGSRCGKLLRFLLSEVDNWIYDQIEEKEKEK